MKKQELIHVHGLLGEVRKQYEFWNEDIDLEGYEELGVEPTDIHKSKTHHKAAVMELADGITGDEVDHNLDPYDEDELYQVLEENAEPDQTMTEEGLVSRPRVSLTVDMMTKINQVIGNWNLQDELSRLEQVGRIESDDNDYEVGTDLYLKV